MSMVGKFTPCPNDRREERNMPFTVKFPAAARPWPNQLALASNKLWSNRGGSCRSSVGTVFTGAKGLINKLTPPDAFGKGSHRHGISTQASTSSRRSRLQTCPPWKGHNLRRGSGKPVYRTAFLSASASFCGNIQRSSAFSLNPART